MNPAEALYGEINKLNETIIDLQQKLEISKKDNEEIKKAKLALLGENKALRNNVALKSELSAIHDEIADMKKEMLKMSEDIDDLYKDEDDEVVKNLVL